MAHQQLANGWGNGGVHQPLIARVAAVRALAAPRQTGAVRVWAGAARPNDCSVLVCAPHSQQHMQAQARFGDHRFKTERERQAVKNSARERERMQHMATQG